MVARDDSVIRGSLIACLIFLVLSLALNFFLWRWGDTRSTEATEAKATLQTTQSNAATMKIQNDRLKSMLGIGGFTQAEIDEMKKNTSDDPDMQKIEDDFATNMSIFGPEVEPQGRTYAALPDYLVTTIRSLNDRFATSQEAATKIRTDADADISNARKQQQVAESQRDDANKRLADLTTQFDEDRSRMNKEKEDTKDQLVSTVQDFNAFRRTARDENDKLQQKTRQLQGTIDTQKLQLNELRQDKFEMTQGEVRYVVRGGNVVTINLGSADALLPNVTFGVIDADETRLQDAKVKATIQVTQIQGPHLATARVVARPEIRNPIIPGDKIYSPFWAPGRVVKIALAGELDIDGDGRPDNEAIKGQIVAAGAVVAAEVSPFGAGIDKLDASIRFLVIGDDPAVEEGEATESRAQQIAVMGRVRAKAAELGLTTIPVWKLQNYLKNINDTLTTPLGSAVRGEDFPPDPVVRPAGMPSDIAEIYKTQAEGVQRDNKILPP